MQFWDVDWQILWSCGVVLAVSCVLFSFFSLENSQTRKTAQRNQCNAHNMHAEEEHSEHLTLNVWWLFTTRRNKNIYILIKRLFKWAFDDFYFVGLHLFHLCYFIETTNQHFTPNQTSCCLPEGTRLCVCAFVTCRCVCACLLAFFF